MAILSFGSRRDRFAKRFALVLSLVVHGALAAGAAALATQPPTPADEPITVAIVSDPPPDVLVPDEPPSPPPDVAPVPLAARRPAQAPPRSTMPETPRLAVAPSPPTPAFAEPAAAMTADRSDARDEVDPEDPAPVVSPGTAAAGPSPGVSGGNGVGVGTGAVGVNAGGRGAGAGTGLGTRPLTSGERRALLERYLKLIDPRIRQHFRYPRQAEALELEGDVRIVLAVDGRGQLLRAHTAGVCPHAVLCEDATRTVRASVPLPPPPPELGGVVEVELPLTYRLE